MGLSNDKRVEMTKILTSIERIAEYAGKQLLAQKEKKTVEVKDIPDGTSDLVSTIDYVARDAIKDGINLYLPEYEGLVYFELGPFERKLSGARKYGDDVVIIVDEIDGTHNLKRHLQSDFKVPPPQTVVSLAFCLSKNLKDLVATAVYTLDTGEVFSSLRVNETEFESYCNGQIIGSERMLRAQGDTREYVILNWDTNSHKIEKAPVEYALYKQGFQVQGSCRSSAMDIINILRNQYDAYVDLRSFWQAENRKIEAALQVYDIAGVLAIAQGCGLKVTNAMGKSWQEHFWKGSIDVVVARPNIHQKILDTIRPFVQQWKLEQGG